MLWLKEQCLPILPSTADLIATVQHLPTLEYANKVGVFALVRRSQLKMKPININKTVHLVIIFIAAMNDPYNWHYPQRNETMFMATIENSFHQQKNMRESSFLKTDIPGAQPRRQIPLSVNRQNFANSTYIEPIPQSHVMRNKFIETNNLKTRDIEYAYPQCNQFQTSRVTNPLAPRYKLPYVPPVDPEPPRNLLRNTLDISDIQTKTRQKALQLPEKPSIEGSAPNHLFRTVNAVNRLEVKDINTDGLFISERRNKPTNPLEPSYSWRDQRASLNQSYGDIGNRPREVIPSKVNKRQDLSLGVYDIEGAVANSSNQRKYFLAKRKEYREINRIDDIAKTNASSLKKGITTRRSVNPLMPQYQYPEP